MSKNGTNIRAKTTIQPRYWLNFCNIGAVNSPIDDKKTRIRFQRYKLTNAQRQKRRALSADSKQNGEEQHFPESEMVREPDKLYDPEDKSDN